jgi:hypothetical protein
MLVDRPRGVQLAHHVERLAGEPDRPHGVVDPAAAEAGLGDGERLALAAEQGLPRYGPASGLVTAMTMRNAAVLALEEKNFHPLMTPSPPSLTASVLNWAGSEPACGSVIE